MIKRIVILQDEQLVVREMTRAPRVLHAYAAAGAARGLGGVATEDRDDRTGVIDPETADLDDAPDEAPEPEVPVVMAPAGSRLADVAKSAAIKAERAIIEDTLNQVQWNRRRAAEQLGVSYKTLLNKIKECGISRKA
jgi:DNA-binding NtrC family response regulator